MKPTGRMNPKNTTNLTPVVTDPLKRDFRNFLYVVWKHLNLPDPTPIQYDIADYLQNGPNRRVVEAFRGVGKSWVTSAFVCWRLYCNPDRKILVVSASKQRADDFSTFTLRLIFEMPILAHLKPKDGQRFSKVSFDVGPSRASHAPSVKSLGITSQLAGSRAHDIIADDIEVPNNSDTQTKRDKLKEQIKEFDAILSPGSDSTITYLGTPQTEQSIYNELPNRGYTVRIWPARYPNQKAREKYGPHLAPSVGNALDDDPDLEGKPTDKKRFSNDDLLERELSYGRSGFSLQFMLDTSLSDADKYPLKLSDLVVMDLDPTKAPIDLAYGSSPELSYTDLPNVGMAGDRLYRPFMVSSEWSPYTGIVMAVDPSGRGSDETAYAIVAMLYSRLYLLDAGGLPGGYDMVTLEGIAKLAKKYKVNKVVIEPNFGDGMFNRLLSPVMQRFHPCTIEDTARSVSQKERRIIDSLEPVMNQHRLVVDKKLIQRDFDSTADLRPELINRYRLFYQMTRLTADRGSLAKDDRIDALALAVHYWTDLMEQDTLVAAQQHRDELFQADLDDFMEGVGFGRKTMKTNWM
jgi:hypothetical protein